MTNLILLGFMGTGKTTLGKALSAKLSWPFVDVDVEIEKQQGSSIPQIFSCYGEEYFRQVESRLLSSILSQTGQVVATGGGVVLKEKNRSQIKKGGISILLTASVEVILQRTRESDRPLLQAKDPKKEIQRLLQEREKNYRFADWSLDTGKGSPEELVDVILKKVGEILGRTVG